jgi:hypothetical protein
MVLDALSVVSLAATIIQFVDFGSKIVSKGVREAWIPDRRLEESQCEAPDTRKIELLYERRAGLGRSVFKVLRTCEGIAGAAREAKRRAKYQESKMEELSSGFEECMEQKGFGTDSSDSLGIQEPIRAAYLDFFTVN